jgi:hypothetical protein
MGFYCATTTLKDFTMNNVLQKMLFPLLSFLACIPHSIKTGERSPLALVRKQAQQEIMELQLRAQQPLKVSMHSTEPASLQKPPQKSLAKVKKIAQERRRKMQRRIERLEVHIQAINPALPQNAELPLIQQLLEQLKKNNNIQTFNSFV